MFPARAKGRPVFVSSELLMGIQIRRILGVPAFRRKSGTQFAVNAVLSILVAKLFFDFESLVF